MPVCARNWMFFSVDFLKILQILLVGVFVRKSDKCFYTFLLQNLTLRETKGKIKEKKTIVAFLTPKSILKSLASIMNS